MILYGQTSLLSAAEIAAWPGQYKIKPWEASKLTDADVVGPDGIVYPDWTGVGIEGGLPTINPLSPPSGYTVYTVSGSNDAAVTLAVAAALANADGVEKSIVYFPAGTYVLATSYFINKSGVVIAGVTVDRI